MENFLKPTKDNKPQPMNNDALEYYRREFYKNKRFFETHQYKMSRDQVILENLLLNLEEEALFKDKKEETVDDVLRRTEQEFLRNLDCCGHSFDTFYSFAYHRSSEHSNEEESVQPDIGKDRAFYGDVDGLSAYENYETINTNTIDFNNPQLNDEEKRVKCKPYRCDIEDCRKAYTSAYGLKYHVENGHVKKDDSNKPHACSFSGCEKRYKNSNGLKYHLDHFHR